MPAGDPVVIPPPSGGRPYGVPPHLIEDNQLSDATNVYFENNALRDRRGFNTWAGNDIKTPLGAFHCRGLSMGWLRDPNDQIGLFAFTYDAGEVNESEIYVNKGWHNSSGTPVTSTWDNPTPAGLTNHYDRTPLLGDPGQLRISADPVRGVSTWSLALDNGALALFVASGTDHEPLYFDSNTNPSIANFSTLTDGKQGQFDLIGAAGRLIIGRCRGASNSIAEIDISNVNDPLTIPAGNTVNLVDTPDLLVGFGALTRRQFYVFKENSTWIATSTPGGAFPFRFDLLSTLPGPVSTGSIVYIRDALLYMGLDGNIYQVTTGGVTPIGQSVQPFLAQDIARYRIFEISGSYIPALNQIWWFYPSKNADASGGSLSVPPVTVDNSTRVMGGLVYDLGTGTFWFQDFSAGIGELICSLGEPNLGNVRYADALEEQIGLLVGTTHGNRLIYQLRDGGGDVETNTRGDGGGTETDGATIAASFTTAPRPYGGVKNRGIIRGYIPMFRTEASASNTVTIEFLGGDRPDNLSVLDTKVVDPSATDRIEIADLDVKANWVAIRHTWDVETDHQRIWDGGIIYVDKESDGSR